jgi:glycosyltransferase involved in cell wall biosynthesis
VFPSYFEGYGYPPVEALYCGTPCVAYALPVLKEVCGEHLTLVPIGDREAMGRALALLLAGAPPDAGVIKAVVAARAEFGAFCRLLAIEFESTVLGEPYLDKSRAASLFISELGWRIFDLRRLLPVSLARWLKARWNNWAASSAEQKC